MNRPVLYDIPAFDGRYGTVIKFSFTGNYIRKSEIEFFDGETGLSTGVRVISESPLNEIVIRAGIIDNSSIPYFARVRVYDESLNASEYSEPKLFHCVNTPSFTLTKKVIEGESNLFVGLSPSEQGNTLTEASIKVALNYDKGEHNEELNSYTVSLYDGDKRLISSSKILYAPNIEYEFLGLATGNTYYLRAYGDTQNGMSLDTGYYMLRVSYETPTTYTMMSLKNRSETADIYIKSNIVSIDGKTNLDNVTYVDVVSDHNPEDAAVLLENDAYVEFNENFEVPEDFSLELVIVNYNSQNVVMKIKNDTEYCDFIMCHRNVVDDNRENNAHMMYCILMGGSTANEFDGRQYTTQSNHIPYKENIRVALSVKREDGLWQMKLREVK